MKINTQSAVSGQYKKTILPNGIKILSENIPYVKSFSLGFWFNVGSRDENFNNNGITHFIEHMLFKGTRKRSAKRIATEIESLGGYLNAFTSKEQTCYYGRGLAVNFKKTFEVLADMIQNPALKPSEIKKEASVVIDELNDIQDNPEELIFDKFEEILFAGNSLSLPIIGSAKNIANFSQSDLLSFLNSKYSSNRLIITASGAIEHDRIAELAGKLITKDLGSSPVRRKQYTTISSPSPVEFINKEIQQVHAILGRQAGGFKDQRRAAVAVLAQVLGEGSSSRLFQAVRERNGIAYQINSFLNSFSDVSAFGVYLSTNDKMIDKALSIISKEFEKIRTKKIAKTELRKAKAAIKGNLILSLENTTNRMIRIAQNELYFNRIKTIDEVIKEIDSVNREEILDLCNDLLDEKKLVKVIIKSRNGDVKFAA